MTIAFIDPPRRIPIPLRLGLWISRRVTGDDVLAAQLLTWYPRSAVGIGVLESLVAHGEAASTSGCCSSCAWPSRSPWSARSAWASTPAAGRRG